MIHRLLVALVMLLQFVCYLAYLMVSIPWLLLGGIEWIVRGKSKLLTAGAEIYESFLEPWFE